MNMTFTRPLRSAAFSCPLSSREPKCFALATEIWLSIAQGPECIVIVRGRLVLIGPPFPILLLLVPIVFRLQECPTLRHTSRTDKVPI